MKYTIYYNGERVHGYESEKEVISYLTAGISEDRRITIDNIIAKLENIRYYADERITYYEMLELKGDIDELDDERLYGAYDVKNGETDEKINAYDFLRERGVI